MSVISFFNVAIFSGWTKEEDDNENGRMMRHKPSSLFSGWEMRCLMYDMTVVQRCFFCMVGQKRKMITRMPFSVDGQKRKMITRMDGWCGISFQWVGNAVSNAWYDSCSELLLLHGWIKEEDDYENEWMIMYDISFFNVAIFSGWTKEEDDNENGRMMRHKPSSLFSWWEMRCLMYDMTVVQRCFFWMDGQKRKMITRIERMIMYDISFFNAAIFSGWEMRCLMYGVTVIRRDFFPWMDKRARG